MSYIEDVMRELRALFPSGWEDRPGTMLDADDIDAILTFVRQKVAESYKNGMAAQERAKAAQRAVVQGRGLTGPRRSLR